MTEVTLKAEQARTEWRQTLDKAYAKGKDVVIIRYGEPIVTIVNHAKWKTWRAREKRLRELEMLLKIRTRVAEIEADPTLSISQAELEQQLAAAGIRTN